jgi:hypothetical protein
MKETFAFKLEIRRPEGHYEEMVVQATRLLIGAGAHCDVRIGGEGAGREHLVLDLVDGVLRGKSRQAFPPPYCKGKPFIEGTLGKSAELAVAGTRIRVLVVEAPSLKRGGRAKRLATSVFVALGVLAAPALVYAALRQEPEAPIGPPPSEVTPLFDAARAACPVASVDQAAASGAAAREVAEQQREQHPFAVADGLAAVGSFDLASSCFARAGQREQAAAMASARDGLRKRIEDDYRVHRVRLEHALDEGEDKMALAEVRVLRRLTTGRHGAYISWLEMVDRHLDVAVRTAASAQ